MSRVTNDIELANLIARLNAKFGKDFSSYRLGCLERRIALRMATLRIDHVDEYIDYLSSNPEEIEKLLDTVTIHVTEFFRDAEVFETIAKNIIPGIVHGKAGPASRTVRVWSAGCSTGEEAYSLAIVFLEHLRIHKADIGLEVFATDISKEAYRTARRGVYEKQKVGSIPGPLRERYFEPAPGGLRVSADVRRAVLFSVHDLFQAPPFSRLDLVVCRNVLIHFDHVARNEVLARFHRALVDGGVLVLGKTEALTGASVALFDLVDPRNKIYRKSSSAIPEGGKR